MWVYRRTLIQRGPSGINRNVMACIMRTHTCTNTLIYDRRYHTWNWCVYFFLCLSPFLHFRPPPPRKYVILVHVSILPGFQINSPKITSNISSPSRTKADSHLQAFFSLFKYFPCYSTLVARMQDALYKIIREVEWERRGWRAIGKHFNYGGWGWGTKGSCASHGTRMKATKTHDQNKHWEPSKTTTSRFSQK